jgi:hypothetical protein
MAKDFWDNDPVADQTPADSGGDFWLSDPVDGKRDLPEGVKPSTAGAGRGSSPASAYNPPAPAAPAQAAPAPRARQAWEDDADQLMADSAAPAVKKTSVLEGIPLQPEKPWSFREASENRRRLDDAPISRGRSYADSVPEGTDIGMDVAETIKNPAARGLVAGVAGLGKVLPGAVRAAADFVGADGVSDFAGRAAKTGDQMATPLQPKGGNEKLVFDIANSITQTAPTMMAGLVGGPAMKVLFAQSAAQEYTDGRSAGLDGASAAGRAGIMAGAEVIGERFGFTEQMQILKSLAKRVPADQLAPVFARQIMKEIPGEQLTTLIQFLGDKAGPGALNPEATLSDYLSQAGETLKVTIGQTAVMGGGPTVINKVREGLAKPIDRTPQIEKLRKGGDELAAAHLERKQNQEQAAYSADKEAGALADFGPGLQSAYKAIRSTGAKTGDAVSKASSQWHFEQAAQMAGLSPKAQEAITAKLAELPPEKAAAFVQKAVTGLVNQGMGQPFQGMDQIAVTIEQQRDRMLDSVLSVMDDIETTEGKQDGTQDTADAAAGQAIDSGAPASLAGEQGSIGTNGIAESALPDGQSELETALRENNDVQVTPEMDAVHQAATSPMNDLPEPTQAQKDAGNYKVGRVKVGGMDISIENPQGSERRGTDSSGKAWATPMRDHYGYFKGTEAADGDKLDVFIKPGTPQDFSGTAYVVDQIDPGTGKFDEHKVVFGAADQAEAEAIYRRNYDADWKGLGAITPLPMPAFKAWASSNATRKPLGALPNVQNTPAPAAGAKAQAAPVEAPAAGSGDAAKAAGGEGKGSAGGLEADGVKEVVRIKDKFNRTHRVFKDDLDSNKDRIPTVRWGGDVVSGEEIPRSIIKQDGEVMADRSQKFTPQEKSDMVSGRELARTIAEEAATEDFDPSELPEVIRQWAENEKLPEDMIRQSVLKVIGEYKINAKTLRQIKDALNPVKQAVSAEKAKAAGVSAKGGAGDVQANGLKIGTTPKNAEAVTVKNGVVHIGKYEAVNYDTGEPVTVADGATDAQIKQALKDAGALSKKQKVFGGAKEEAQTLQSLKEAMDKAPPVTMEHLSAIRAFNQASVKDAEDTLNAGEMPVYRSSTGLTSVITPSAQKPGKFQVTRYNKTGAFGDSQYNSIEDAVRDNQIDGTERLSGQEAEDHMQTLVKAEGEYQDRKKSGEDADAKAKAEASITPAAKAEKPAPAPKPVNDKTKGFRVAATKKNPFWAFLGRHGMSMDLAKEFAPGKTERQKAIVSGFGPIFKRVGLGIDMLAEMAKAEGFIATEDVAELHDLISRAFSGERIIPQYAEGAADTEMQARQAAMEEAAQTDYEDFLAVQKDDPDADIPWDSDELTQAGYDGLTADEQKQLSALLQSAESEGIDAKEIQAEAESYFFGKKDHEYKRRIEANIEAARNSRKATDSGAGTDAAGSEAERGGAGRGGETAGQEGVQSAKLEAWQTEIPPKGVSIQTGDQKLDGSRQVIRRIAKEAVDAVTQNQKTNGGALYAYVLPAANGTHGAVRLFPDDQTPQSPWKLLFPEAVRYGFVTPEQTAAKLAEALAREPVLSSDPEPVTTKENPDGTLSVTGDTAAIKATLTAAGIPAKSVMKSARGVVVGKTQAKRARNVLEGRDADKIAARSMTYEGRATDGKPLMPGDIFTTASGRETTPFPKQSGQKYATQWTIDNAIAEAESRGDDFNATAFRAEKPGKNGYLPPASSDMLHEYLFGQQPVVVRSIFKPLVPGRETVDTSKDKKIGVDSRGRDVFEGSDGSLKGVRYTFDERGRVNTGALVEESPTLTAPTKADIEAQQDRTEQADKLDQREQTRKESEVGDSSFMTGFMGDGRQDNTGSLFDSKPEQAESNPAEKIEADRRPSSPLEEHKALRARIDEGKASVDEYRAGFESFLASKEAVIAGYMTLKKDDLLAMISPYYRSRYKSETKGDVAEALFDDGVASYTLGKTLSYSMGGKDSRTNAIRKIVEGVDADQLAQHAQEVKDAREESIAARAKLIEAVKEPKTLDDFRQYMGFNVRQEGMGYKEARMTLTPEQRAEFDILLATESRSKRKETKDIQKAVRVAGQQVDAKIIATKHTKKGHDVYVVQLAERVAREDYETLNVNAKKMGGYYSSFRGSGATPGFQFTDRDTAQAFVQLANGDSTQAQQAADARRDAFADDRSQSAVERLNEMADKLDERADDALGQDRKANTQRRARFAASAEKAANDQKAMAKTMRNIADAIEGGDVQFLDRVRQKVQVEMLAGFVRTAQDAELRAKYPAYADFEKRKGQPPTTETADSADFPSYTAFRSDLASLGRQLLEQDGTKLLGQRLMKVADDVTDAFNKFAKDSPGKLMAFRTTEGGVVGFSSKAAAEASIARSGYKGKALPYMVKRGEYTIILSPSEAINRGIWDGDGDKRITLSTDFGSELVEKIGKAARRGGKVSVPWQFESASDKLKGLARMGIETPAEFRSALREFIGLKEQAAEADKVKQMERAMIGRAKDGLDFFPTPQEVADQMIDAAGIEPDMAVLEPSAGMGHIADRIRETGAEPDVIEMSGDRRELLEAKGYNIANVNDFMDMKPRSFFTYGDVFKAPDGTEGVMTGGGGMGSNRVILKPLMAYGTVDARRGEWYNREDLTGIRHQGVASGYDRIVMNPPFSDGRDIQHVQHAYSLLRPGGRIVALMGESAFTNQNKRATEFRAWLEEVGGTEEKLGEGSFMDPSLPVNTGANARMVVIDKPEGEAPAFSRPGAQQTSKRGLSKPEVQKAIASVTGQWKNGPKITVVDSTADLPMDAPSDVQGVYVNGSVYLVAENIDNKAQALNALAHEAIAHLGLRELLGKDDFKKLMNNITLAVKTGNKPLNAIKAEVRKAYVDGKGNFNLSALQEADEIAAKVVEQAIDADGNFRPGFGFVKSVYAKIADFLRSIGITVKFTNAELQGLLVNAQRNLETGKRTEGARSLMEPVFSRIDQTLTEAFKKWFGDSVVTENGKAGGKPLVVYHGTSESFSKFSSDFYGDGNGNNDWGDGFYFTDSPKAASGYANLDGGNVMPVFLSMKNPASEKTMMRRDVQDAVDDGMGFTSVQEVLERLGHDGIAIKHKNGEMEYVVFRPAQIKSATGNNGNFDGTNPDIRFSRSATLKAPAPVLAPIAAAAQPQLPNVTQPQAAPVPLPEETKARAAQRRVQDQFNRFTVIRNWAQENGMNLSQLSNVWGFEERMHGRIASRLEDFREDRVKPLVQKIQKAGFTMADVAEFLHALHAGERNKQILTIDSSNPSGSGMTDADANAILAKASPALKALANEFRDITTDTRQILLDAGIISADMAKAWDDTYQHYVPLKGGDEDTQPTGTGKGLSVKATNKRAMGHGERSEFIVENIMRDHERAVMLAEKNLVGHSLLAMAIELGRDDIATVGKPERRKVMKNATNFEVVAKNGTVLGVFDSQQGANSFIVTQTRPGLTVRSVKGDPMVSYSASPMLAENEVQVYARGHTIRIQLNDPLLARAYKKLGVEQLTAMMRINQEVNTFLSKAYTGYNPEFFSKNVLRDFTSGLINITGQEGAVFAAKAAARYPKAFAQMLRYSYTGTASPSIKLYREHGGSTGAAYLGDIERIGADIQNAYEEYQGAIQLAADGRPLTSAKVASKKLVKMLVSFMEHLNAAGENSMRLAVFDTMRAEPGRNIQEAASLAKNATVNFNRKGEIGAQANALYLFFNAGMQGSAATLDALFNSKHKHQAQAIAGTLGLLAYSLAAMQFGGDDDEDKNAWEKVPDYVKDRNLVIRTGKDTFITLSIPYGYGFFFTIGNSIFDLQRGGDKDKIALKLTSGLLEHFGPAINPLGGDELDEKGLVELVPGAFGGEMMRNTVRLVANRSGFGSQIVPDSAFDDGKPDSQRMFRSSKGTPYEKLALLMNQISGGTKSQAGFVDVSPETVKFWVETVTGGTGKFVVDTATVGALMAASLVEEDPEIANALMPEIRELPIVRTLVRKQDIRDARQAYWDTARKVLDAQADFKRAKSMEDMDGMESVVVQQNAMLALAKTVEASNKAIKARRDFIDKVNGTEEYSRGEKRLLTKQIEQQENAIYESMIEIFEGAKKSKP